MPDDSTKRKARLMNLAKPHLLAFALLVLFSLTACLTSPQDVPLNVTYVVTEPPVDLTGLWTGVLESKSGGVVDVKTVEDTDNLMFISKKGIAIKVKAKNISTIGRNTQGVTIMKLKEGDKLVGAANIKE